MLFRRTATSSLAAARLVQEWRTQQVPLNRGASARELRVLEDLLGMRLPDDLAALYSLANGMQDYAHDQHHVSFWSIQRMVADRNDKGPDEIGFADFLIGSWYFVYKPNPPAAVTICWQSDPGESLPSVSAFLEAYASTPERFCVL